MSLTAGLAHISFWQLSMAGAMALLASIVGGLAGYGTGVLMPLVLVPIVGAEPVVPIISISALFTNSSRVAAFRQHVDLRRALIVLAGAVPTCVVGAYGYTRLTDRGALIVIGVMLALTVPLRRLLARRAVHLGSAGLAVGAAGFGARRRNHGRRRPPAVYPDGGGSGRRRGDRDRRCGFHRDRRRQGRGVRRSGRDHPRR